MRTTTQSTQPKILPHPVNQTLERSPEPPDAPSIPHHPSSPPTSMSLAWTKDGERDDGRRLDQGLELGADA
jgi:hypothetical protein